MFLGNALLESADDPDSYGKVYISFTRGKNDDPTDDIPLGYYGQIGHDSRGYYLLNDKAVYVYPEIDSITLQTLGELYLKVNYLV